MFRDIIVQSCIQACVDCAVQCEQCAAACLAEKDVQSKTRCIQLCRDAASIANLAVKFLANNSDFAQSVCETCVEVFLACRDECARHEDDRSVACAEACHKAAEHCEKLSLQPV